MTSGGDFPFEKKTFPPKKGTLKIKHFCEWINDFICFYEWTISKHSVIYVSII